MCGNFGLLMLGQEAQNAGDNGHNFQKKSTSQDELDRSITGTLHEVGKLHGKRYTSINH